MAIKDYRFDGQSQVGHGFVLNISILFLTAAANYHGLGPSGSK